MSELKKAKAEMQKPGLWLATICFLNNGNISYTDRPFDLIVRTGASSNYVTEHLTGMQIPIIYNLNLYKIDKKIGEKLLTEYNLQYGVVLTIKKDVDKKSVNKYEFIHTEKSNDYTGPFNKHFSLEQSKKILEDYTSLHSNTEEFRVALENYIDTQTIEIGEYNRREHLLKLEKKN